MKKTVALVLALLLALSAVGALADYGAILKKNATVYSDSRLRTPLGTLPKNMAVVVKSVSSGKAKLSYLGKTVYVKSKYVYKPWEEFLDQRKKKGIDHTEDCLRYVKKTCYVYDYPSTKGHKLGKVKKGVVLTGFREIGGWSVVMDIDEKYYGFIKTSKLEGISGADGTHYKLD